MPSLTLRQAVSDVRSSLKLVSSDDIINDRAIAAELITTSLVYIRRETNTRKLFSSDNIFTEISCLSMEQVPIAECCNYTSPCNIGRSVETLPRIVENIYGPLIQGVYSIDGKVRFDYMDPDRYANFLKIYPEKKESQKVFWKRNGYLYVSDPNIETVKILALFEEDVDFSLYNCPGDEDDCPENPLDLEFKCPGYLWKGVKDSVRDMLQDRYKRSIEDKTEDDNSTAV